MATKKIIKKATKDTTLQDILKTKGADRILAKHRVPCLSCPMAEMEISDLKIGDVCEAYGIDLEKLLKELNR
jgi:hybrid cluster-associated redox disulfide protein